MPDNADIWTALGSDPKMRVEIRVNRNSSGMRRMAQNSQKLDGLETSSREG